MSHRGTRYEKEYGWQWRAEAESEADKMISQFLSQKVTHKTNFLRFLWRGDRNETPYQGTAVHTSRQNSSRMTGRDTLRTHENSVSSLSACPRRQTDSYLQRLSKGGQGQ